MAIDYKKIAAKAAETTDHNERTSGGDFEFTPPAAGVTMGRFIEYIELGEQPQRPYKGQAKADAPTARFTFELLAKKNLKEIETDGGKKTVADRISFDLPIKLNDKASYIKLYEAMRYGRDGISHMSQMLNDAFVITVVHNEVEKDGKKKVYANISKDGAYLIAPPVVVDPVQGTETKVPVPNAISDVKVFIWDLPCKESWASLHIEGTRTVKDEKGNEREVSKNWLQEKILSASNFQGSPLEELLTGAEELNEALAEAEAKPVAKKSVAASSAAKASPKVTTKATQAKPATVAKTATTQTKSPSKPAAVDPLAALGL